MSGHAADVVRHMCCISIESLQSGVTYKSMCMCTAVLCKHEDRNFFFRMLQSIIKFLHLHL